MKVGQRTGEIKRYDELRQEFNRQGIKIDKDKFYQFLRLHNLLVPNLKNDVKITKSKHQFRKHKNLVKDLLNSRIGEV